MVQAEKRSNNSNNNGKKRKRTTTTSETSYNMLDHSSPPPLVVTMDPPVKTLIIDNGGDTIKYGWSTTTKDHDSTVPQTMPNVTARLQQQWTVLVGDQLSQITNPTQLIGVTRSTERGIIVNMGNQIQVWKRILDIMNIEIPLNTPTAQLFGWKGSTGSEKKISLLKQKNNTTTTKSNDPVQEDPIPSSSCAVLIALPPFCPRIILDQIMTIWMDDFHFGHVGFCSSQLCATISHSHPIYQTCCIVDLGWSHTYIVPTFQNKGLDPLLSSSSATTTTLRRIPIGGRHLIQIWKYYTSYRQWNLMDSEYILRQVLEELGYLSLQFTQDMQIALRVPNGRRPYDREFILPNFHDTFVGTIQLPPYLQRRQVDNNVNDSNNDEDNDNSEDDEDFKEEDMEEDKNDDDEDLDENFFEMKETNGYSVGKKQEVEEDDDDDDDDDDDEEETLEQIKARLLIQKQEEERRRRELEAQQQILNISVERFAIPETLFRPSDVGFPTEWANLPESIFQSIEACPELYRPALYRSIRLVGGLSQLKNIKERLEQELRCLVGCKYEIQIEVSQTPITDAWYGAKQLCSQNDFQNWSISRGEWEKTSKKGAWVRLLASHGGNII